MSKTPFSAPLSRRRFLTASSASLLASQFPWIARAEQGEATSVAAAPSAQPTPGGAKYRRYNLMDPKAAPMLASYERAITAMLKLPYSDPRNWYRHSFIHLLDCPHGNWWLLPWHRGYIGWLERICRELSQDPNFALPFWDWTATPQVPDSFTKGMLNPANFPLPDMQAFQAALTGPLNDFWQTLSNVQLEELKTRGYNSTSDVWAGITGDPAFFPSNQARMHTDFDAPTKKAVSLSTIQDALNATVFITALTGPPGFGSGQLDSHDIQPSGNTIFGILEGQPHNNVHNRINGLMGDFLSPVDPIFFMHHANIDRLWDVWDRKQKASNLPTLPPSSALPAWYKEPFLFYVDAKGKPVQQTTCKDYVTIGSFDYDYQLGSGDKPVFSKPKKSPFSEQLFAANLGNKLASLQSSVSGSVNAPKALLQEVQAADPTRLFARITLVPPTNTRGLEFHVLLNPDTKAASVSFEDPSYAGTFRFFGHHHHEVAMAASEASPSGMMPGMEANKPITFTVGLTDTVKSLAEAGRLKPGEPLQIHVVAAREGVNLAPVEVPVNEVSIGAF